jgi:hypothetical protein
MKQPNKNSFIVHFTLRFDSQGKLLWSVLLMRHGEAMSVWTAAVKGPVVQPPDCTLVIMDQQ